MSIKSPFVWMKYEAGDPLGLAPVEGSLDVFCDGCGAEATLALPQGWTLSAKAQVLPMVRFFCVECRKKLHGQA